MATDKLSQSMKDCIVNGVASDGQVIVRGRATTEDALISRGLVEPHEDYFRLTQEGLKVRKSLSEGLVWDGLRVRSSDGRTGTVNGVDSGSVSNANHPNHGRRYVGVNWDGGVDSRGQRGRAFVDELTYER